MFLCRTVFHMPLAMAKQLVTEAEVTKWIAAYKIEAWGDDWQQASLITSTMMNIHTKAQFYPDDFIPFRIEEMGTGRERFLRERINAIKELRAREKRDREKKK